MFRVMVAVGFGLLAMGVELQAAEREPWTASRVKGSPEPPKPYTVERVYPKMQFDQPVELMPLANTGKMLVLEVGGKVFTFDDDQDCEAADLAFDLAPCMDEFRRALGIAVHPNFASNHEIFVCYAGDPVARPDGSRISRFKMSMEGVPRIDPDSEEILLTWASGGHNGCALRFDQAGLLYFSAGDGARPYPPDEYDVSQDLSDLRSSICRIDVDRREAGRGYSIPVDNPFVDVAGARPEIWAYGLRNPWRFSIDPKTQQMMCGDVGWELWELVFHIERGGNYGWSIFEGPQPIRSDIQPGPTPIRKPIVAYPHTEGLSVTGGFTYRGSEFPELEGAFIYGDYVTGLVWGLRFEGEQATWNELLAETGQPIITFAESREHEILVVSFEGGIFKLVRNDAVNAPSSFPTKLSETGLFSSTANLQPSPGVYRYSVRAQAFQGGATSQFVVGVPGDGTIKTNIQKRNWQYPKDIVFAKTLSRDVLVDGQQVNRRIETQLLHHDGTTWQPYCYVWNQEQTDALLVDQAGAISQFETLDANLQKSTLQWRHHSRSECRACHAKQAGGAVAFSFENLGAQAGIFAGREQVDAFVELGILDHPPQPKWKLQTMVDPDDESQPLEKRARSYLATNCSHCHCRGGGGTVALDLVYSNATDAIFALDFPTTQGTFDIRDARVIAPGEPFRSALFYRMATSGNGHMPKLWMRDNDESGLRLMHDWIKSLETTSHGSPTSVEVSPAEDTAQPLARFYDLLTTAGHERSQLALAEVAEANALTLGLFERFLPASQRTRRLGNYIDIQEILAMPGNAQAGREHFLTSKVHQCRNCHRLAGQGQMIGPDLDGIAQKRTRQELLENIISPSQTIEPQFQTYSVVTVDGKVITGLRLDQGQDAIELRSADGQTHRLARNDIEHMTAQKTSLMPDGLAAEMTAQELADLVAFLAELK